MGSLQQSRDYFCVVLYFCFVWHSSEYVFWLSFWYLQICLGGSKPWNCIKVTNQINHINIYRTHLSTGENWTYIFSGECSCNFSTHVQNVTICIWFMGIQFIHSRKEDTECIGWYKSNYTTSNLQWNFVYSWYVSLSYRLITHIMPLGVVELGVRRHMLCLMTRNISLKQPQRGSMQIIKTPMEMSCHRT